MDIKTRNPKVLARMLARRRAHWNRMTASGAHRIATDFASREIVPLLRAIRETEGKS